MYPISKAFLQAMQENTWRFFWIGRITTKAGAIHEFGNEDIVKGSCYITSQCCDSAEIEIGTVYAAEYYGLEQDDGTETTQEVSVEAEFLVVFSMDEKVAVSVKY